VFPAKAQTLPLTLCFSGWHLIRQDDSWFQSFLGKVFQVQRHDEIRVASFCAETERIIPRIWRNLDGTDSDCFGAFANQVNDFPDQVRTDAEASKNWVCR